jgi:hypothetical protein
MGYEQVFIELYRTQRGVGLLQAVKIAQCCERPKDKFKRPFDVPEVILHKDGVVISCKINGFCQFYAGQFIVEMRAEVSSELLNITETGRAEFSVVLGTPCGELECRQMIQLAVYDNCLKQIRQAENSVSWGIEGADKKTVIPSGVAAYNRARGVTASRICEQIFTAKQVVKRPVIGADRDDFADVCPLFC